MTDIRWRALDMVPVVMTNVQAVVHTLYYLQWAKLYTTELGKDSMTLLDIKAQQCGNLKL
jgi:hypothetical protein